MTTATTNPSKSSSDSEAAQRRAEVAKRALVEAEARRAAAAEAETPREYNGRGGADPARYGDWEVKGIASDF